MTFQHAVLWMDHENAIILALTPEEMHRQAVRCPQRRHNRDRDSLDFRAERDRMYFTAVAEALDGTPEILLLGPAETHTSFLTWLKMHRPEQAHHILKSAAWDHSTDKELAAEGRRFFHAADRMRPRL